MTENIPVGYGEPASVSLPPEEVIQYLNDRDA